MQASIYDGIYSCTCSHFYEQLDHEESCALWDNPKFYDGLMWEPNSQTLIPWDDNVELVDGDEYLDDGIDLVEAALKELLGDDKHDEFDEIYKGAVEYVGHKVLDVIELITAGGEELYPDDLDALEEFALTVHRQPQAHDLPIYDCYCYTTKHDECEECGVRKVKVGEKSRFVPTNTRIKLEVSMSLEGTVHDCTCANKSKAALLCFTCNVQRSTADSVWTYYNSKAGWGEDGYTGSTSTVSTWTQKCRHYSQEVIFPDGTKIWASSSHDRKNDEPEPDFGIYMYDGWPNHALAYKLTWTDYGLPVVTDQVVWTAADHGLTMAREGKTVEIGCMGGHGRTGTFMAIMLLNAGFEGTPAEAVKWVHDNYCKEAIEGSIQEWYIEKMYAEKHGLPIPQRPHTYTEHKVMYDKGNTCDCNSWASDLASFNKPISYSDTTYLSAKPQGDCSTYRHEVIWWRHWTCNCKSWATDAKMFAANPAKYVKRKDGPLPEDKAAENKTKIVNPQLAIVKNLADYI